MEILIISDSHGYLSNLRKVLNQYKNQIKYVIHLGDYDEDISEIKPEFQSYEFINVSGNCDFGTSLPSEKVFELCGKRFFITHGHRYSVKSGLTKISYMAEEKSSDICLLGHTHIPLLTSFNDVVYMNPGSISCPRSEFSNSYGIIEISNDKISAKVIEISPKGERVIMKY